MKDFLPRIGLSRLLSARPITPVSCAAIAAMLFFLALGVRLLHWQDQKADLRPGDTLSNKLFKGYLVEANRMVTEQRLLYPKEPVPDGDARLILHPPGYSILLAALYGDQVMNASYDSLVLIQIICDALSVSTIFLIAIKLLPLSIGIVAGLLSALSPHLSHYALWLSPDSLPVLPLLIAVYFVIRAIERTRLVDAALAGGFIGLSCWFRANGMAISIVLAIVLAVLLPRGKRVLFSSALLGAAVLSIAPITIRNYIVYGRFVPLSIAAGENLLVGIGDCDRENRFGMPRSDREAAEKDAEWFNRPEYAANPWAPDGIERDQARLRRGLQFIWTNPGWFAGAMLSRIAFMVSFNQPDPGPWPFNTRNVPFVSAEPPFGHATADRPEPSLVLTAAQLAESWEVMSPQAEVRLDSAGSLEVKGDSTEFGDQLVSAPISVRDHTDYVLVLYTSLDQGKAAVKITDTNRRITVASQILIPIRPARQPISAKINTAVDIDETAAPIHFATGPREEVRLVLSNDGAGDRPIVRLFRLEAYEMGPTPLLWTRIPRNVVRGLQKNLFTTARMLPLAIAGLVLLLATGRIKALGVILAVPIYYLGAQSMLSTEYRYILPVPFFLFILAALSLFLFAIALGKLAGLMMKTARGNRSPKKARADK